MVFLFALLADCLVVIPSVVATAAFAIILTIHALSEIESGGVRAASWFAIGPLCVSLAYPLIQFVLRRLPNYHLPGDGGIGMAHNASAVMATVLLTPISVCIVLATTLRLIQRSRNHLKCGKIDDLVEIE